jgi:hypothetical protein
MGLHQGGKKWAKKESIIQRCLVASPLGVVPTKLSIYNNVTSDHSETSLTKLLSYYIPRLSPCEACDLFFWLNDISVEYDVHLFCFAAHWYAMHTINWSGQISVLLPNCNANTILL